MCLCSLFYKLVFNSGFNLKNGVAEYCISFLNYHASSFKRFGFWPFIPMSNIDLCVHEKLFCSLTATVGPPTVSSEFVDIFS